jgi:hypothetical protein
MTPLALLLALLGPSTATEPDRSSVAVLIVADERPPMEVLARELAARARARSEIVTPDAVPPTLAGRPAVVMYVHKDLPEPAEQALLGYARAGGRLVLLHHAISSSKRANREWLPALGVTLPAGDVATGGYKYVDDATFEVENRARRDPVTTRGVPYSRAGHSFTMRETEVYLNHVLDGPRTTLLRLRWKDPGTGTTWQQDTAGWRRPLGRGIVYYFMPGHKASDFANPSYAQILTNAITGRP